MNFKELGLPEHLEYHEIPVHSKEWYEFRNSGIGGSEVGSVMKMSDYKSSLQLYYEKIGRHTPPPIMNEAIFTGTHLEDFVLDVWKCWDDVPGGYMHNYDNGEIKRDCFKPSGYIVNPKYPWLFASLDGLAAKGQFKIKDMSISDKPFIVEVKNMNSMVLKKWDNDIPPYYKMQLVQYMTVLELDYAEIIILKDGRNFMVDYFEVDEKMKETFLKVTKSFWYNRVLPGREAVEESDNALLNGEKEKHYDLENIIVDLEPEADDTESYGAFLKEIHESVGVDKSGNMEEYDATYSYQVWHEVSKIADKQKKQASNKIRSIMRKDGVDRWNFGEEGYISITAGSTNRINPKLKIDFDKDKATAQIERVIL